MTTLSTTIRQEHLHTAAEHVDDADIRPSYRFLGFLCILMPVTFLICYMTLLRVFGYPAIADGPGADVIAAYIPNATLISSAFYVIAMSELVRIAVAVGLHQLLNRKTTQYLAVFSIIGILAGLVRMLDYVLWPFLLPRLVELSTDPAGTALAGDLFRVLFSYLGDALGGNLGILFLFVWIFGVSFAAWQTRVFPRWVAIFGIVSGILVGINYIEFLGSTSGFIGILGIIGQSAQNIWFVILGTFLLFGRNES